MSDTGEQQDFQAPDPAALASLFPGYEIRGLIATGGMGAVYHAVQKSLDRNVALKILPTELSHDTSFRSGFEAEAKAMAKLNHPNLIGVYDFGEVAGMLYIIMEYVPGKSLFHSAYGIQVDPTEVIRLISGICDGLAHAHEHGILHRDIKPANILLDKSAQPKIGDFGLARPVDRKFDENEGIFGTPHYTAPEVIHKPHSVDYRADIFSVGVMLHELLTNKLPADDPRPASVIAKCDPRFDKIIQRATNPDPFSRYASAKDLAHDLKVIGSSPKSPQSHKAQRGSGKKKSVASIVANYLVALIMLGIIGAGIHYMINLPPTPPKEQATVLELPALPDQGEQPANDSASNTSPPEPPPEKPPEGEMPTEVADKTEKKDDSAPVDGGFVLPNQVDPSLPAARFNVPAFMEKAHKYMLVDYGCGKEINSATSKLRGNLDEFEREAKRLIRKDKAIGNKLESKISKEMEEWKKENRLPNNLGGEVSAVTDIEGEYDKYLEVQKGIESALYAKLTTLAPTYILGMEKQLERLKADNDVGAIPLIQQEIDATKQDSEYFPKLMIEKAAAR